MVNQIIATICGKKGNMVSNGLNCSIHQVTSATVKNGIMKIINIGGDGKDHTNYYETDKYDIEIELFNPEE